MISAALAEALDRPAWSALDGPHERFAEVVGSARRYQREVATWGGLEEPTDAAFADLRELAGPGSVAVFFEGPLRWLPDGYEQVGVHACVQMIAPPDLVVTPVELGEVVDLDAHDVGDMQALVSATRPGPFFSRTFELGGYVGVRVDGELVAMAGQRMRVDGACEISAVCTRPDHRGRGVAAALTARVAARIAARGEVSFLHARTDNTAARRLYEHLGFDTRTSLAVTVVRLPD